MKDRINKLFRELTLISKIALIVWFAYSLTSLNVLSVHQWILIFLAGCLIFIFPIQVFTKRRKQKSFLSEGREYMNVKSPEPEPEPEPEKIVSHAEIKNNETSEINIEKIEMDLERANLLYEIVQTTDDKEIFFLSLNEICQILYSLTTYEDCVDFITPPSEQLKLLNLKRNDLINALEERIRISNINLDEYAKECNDYVSFKDKFDFDNMDGHDFEYFCANLLKNNGFKNVEVTQGSGDHGIDILAEKDGISYAIQCKCYSKGISNSAVQQAHTGKSIYKKDIAVVMTNRDFTPQAKEEAEALGVKLWNRDKLLHFINNYSAE